MSKDPYKEMAREMIRREINETGTSYMNPELGVAALNVAEVLVHLKLDHHIFDDEEVHASHTWLGKIEYLISQVRTELPDDPGKVRPELEEVA